MQSRNNQEANKITKVVVLTRPLENSRRKKGTMISPQIWSLCVAIVIAIAMPILTSTQPLNMVTTPNTTKPGCPRKCGNITVPYPFGIGMRSGCSLSSWYDVLCATSFDPPKAYLPAIQATNQTAVEILEISDTQIQIRNQFVAYECFNSQGNQTSDLLSDSSSLGYYLPAANAPYRLSTTANRLITVGCNDAATLYIRADDFGSASASSSCSTNCSSPDKVVSGSCDGHGCCEATIPNGPSRSFGVSMSIGPVNNHTFIASWDPCGYAFVGEQGTFSFRGTPDLKESYVGFVDRVKKEVPVVLNWVAQNGISCKQAQLNSSTYLCKQPNTACVDVDPVLGGYRCSCKKGYQGNPYLPSGCTDTNECEWENSPCSMHCVNTVGSYKCSCPSGYFGDGTKDGTGCKRLFPKVPVALGASFGFLFLVIGVSWLLLTIREKRIMQRRNKLFQQNGGLLLKQLLPLSDDHDDVQSTKIFTIKELKVATNNFSEESILGTGGYGTVYKGVLPDNQVVAIKKSKVVDESQIEQFINELVVLTRINHPNVVKLLGCCLEAEVPLLVYELISNGTLYDQIHSRDGEFCFSWSNCLRIATEAAKALAHLHAVPIIHRDIKSTNILLDDNYSAKISDFGISRLIPMDKTRMATLVQGTLGYLDPEYFFSSQLTNKSDVYSFGVVLAELFTRKAPILDERYEERNLSMYFVKFVKAGRLTDIVDPLLVKEAPLDQLIIVGRLIQSCLSVKSEDRPTMTEVASVLEKVLMSALE